MLPRNSCNEFLSHLRQFFLIPRQRPFPGTVKTAPAKLLSLFLCNLLKRFRFSPQIVISLPEIRKNTGHPPPSSFGGGCPVLEIIVYVFVYVLGLLRRFLRCVEEDGQHCNGKDHADGVCRCGVVNGSTLCGLAVQQAAQALRCQHEVGGRHSAHEGSGHGGDPVCKDF